jgi:hypothetical protein
MQVLDHFPGGWCASAWRITLKVICAKGGRRLVTRDRQAEELVHSSCLPRLCLPFILACKDGRLRGRSDEMRVSCRRRPPPPPIVVSRERYCC